MLLKSLTLDDIEDSPDKSSLNSSGRTLGGRWSDALPPVEDADMSEGVLREDCSLQLLKLNEGGPEGGSLGDGVFFFLLRRIPARRLFPREKVAASGLSSSSWTPWTRGTSPF